MDPRLIRTRGLVAEVPWPLSSYLTTNQSEDSHTSCSPPAKFAFENSSLKHHGEFRSFEHEGAHTPCFFLTIKLFLLQTPAFQLFSSLCFGHRNLRLSRKFWDFPGSPAIKNLPCNTGDASSIPGWETKIRLHGAVQNEVINSFT